jgi:hypothetical protein
MDVSGLTEDPRRERGREPGGVKLAAYDAVARYRTTGGSSDHFLIWPQKRKFLFYKLLEQRRS